MDKLVEDDNDGYWDDDWCEHLDNEDLLTIEKVDDFEHEGETYPIYRATCTRCGWSYEEVLIQDFASYEVEFHGRKLKPLVGWVNVVQCMLCGRVIFGCPLVMYSDDQDWALTFCIKHFNFTTGPNNTVVYKIKEDE